MGSAPLSTIRLRAQYVHDETCNDAAQIKAPIESLGKSSQVAHAVRAVPQRAKRAYQCRFQLAKHGLDPLELRQAARLKIIHHRRQVNTNCICHYREAPQAVAGRAANRHQAGPGPSGDGLERETADQIELELLRMVVAVHRGGSHKRRLVFGYSSDHATCALTAEMGVVQLNGATKTEGAVQLGHGAVDSLMQHPCDGIANAQLALKRKRSQPGLGSAWLMRQIPKNQIASGSLMCSIRLPAVREDWCLQPPHWLSLQAPWLTTLLFGHGITQAAETVRPARRLPASTSCASISKRRRDSWIDMQSWNLNLLVGHGASYVISSTQITTSPAQGMSLAETGF